jgi:His/Glu/Gln/Arg/opine family amino acid ABC transporter permease subunit
VKRALRTLFVLLLTVGYAAGPASAAPSAFEGAAAPAQDGIPPVLRVGTEGVYPPFSYHDAGGKLTGFDIDVMNAVAVKLGVQVEYVETPWDSMFAALQSKRFDVVANQVTYNDDRKALYDLSDPYVETTGVLVVRKDDTDIKGLADLKGKRAAENLTSNWAGVAKAAGARIVGVDDMSLAITNLEQGRVDALVNDKLAIQSYLASKPKSGVKIVAQTDDVSRSVFAARKDSGYLPQLNKAISELKADGTLTTIYDKYFKADAEPVTKWQLLKDNAWPMARALITVTLPLTAISFAIGLVLALGVGLMRMSSNPMVSAPARFYISVIRGTPLLVQLFIIFYAFPELGVRINPFPAAVIALSLNVAGYAAEVIRSSIESLPRGQWEAASTVGMDYRTTLRRVILPQAARTAVPPLSNTLISLVKDTSLTSVILVVELLRQAQFAAAPTYQFFAMYGLAAVYYYVVCLALSFFQSRAETRLNRFVAV